MSKFVKLLVSKFNIKDTKTRVGIVVFSNNAVPYINLNDNQQQNNSTLMEKVNNLKNIYTGITMDNNTRTGEGIQIAVDMFRSSRELTRKFMVVISDGATTGIGRKSEITPYFKKYLKELRKMQVSTISVGVGLWRLRGYDKKLAKKELKHIASRQGGTKMFYEIENFDRLLKSVKELQKEICLERNRV